MSITFDKLPFDERSRLISVVSSGLDKLTNDVDNKEEDILLLSGIPESEQSFDAKSLQNRDRSRPAYVMQMKKISSNLDYDRISASKTADTGAPMAFVRGVSIGSSQSGKSEVITMADGKGGSVKIPSKYAVVEAKELVASHGADGGKVESYGGKKGIMALNNGRTAAIKEAYKQGNGDSYKSALKADMSGHGVSEKAIDKLKEPVLIRVFSESSLSGIEDAGTASNISSGATLSTSEQAQSDAKRITTSDLMLFEGGDINSHKNGDFVRGFIASMGGTDSNGDMLTSKGTISSTGINRIESALVSRAFKDESILSDISESPDSELKSLARVLKDVSGKWAVMTEAANEGAINKGMDITTNLVDAINLIKKSRQTSAHISELIGQRDAFSGSIDPVTESLVRLMYQGKNLNRIRSANKIANAINKYIASAMMTTEGADMFGHTPNPTEMIDQNGKELSDEEQAKKNQGTIFDSIANHFNSIAQGYEKDEKMNSATFDSLNIIERQAYIDSVTAGLEKVSTTENIQERMEIIAKVSEGLEALGESGIEEAKKIAGIARERTTVSDLEEFITSNMTIAETKEVATLVKQNSDNYIRNTVIPRMVSEYTSGGHSQEKQKALIKYSDDQGLIDGVHAWALEKHKEVKGDNGVEEKSGSKESDGSKEKASDESASEANPITLVWSEASTVDNKPFQSIDDLHAYIKSQYASEDGLKSDGTYDKHKVTFHGNEGSQSLTVYVSKLDEDFNPFTESLRSHIYNGNDIGSDLFEEVEEVRMRADIKGMIDEKVLTEGKDQPQSKASDGSKEDKDTGETNSFESKIEELKKLEGGAYDSAMDALIEELEGLGLYDQYESILEEIEEAKNPTSELLVAVSKV